jgi:hypothetical protein
VTATDSDGHSTDCTFTVTVTDTTPPMVPELPTFAVCGTQATPPIPTTTDNCAGTISGTTTTTFPITNLGTTVVTWLFDDGNGNTASANQAVTVTGLTFDGFLPPIGGTGGTCNSPRRTFKKGTIPVKFRVNCDGLSVPAGTPTLSLKQCSGGNFVGAGNFQLVEDEWHFNWDTTGLSRGVYELTATLQDGSQRKVFIGLNRFESGE